MPLTLTSLNNGFAFGGILVSISCFVGEAGTTIFLKPECSTFTVVAIDNYSFTRSLNRLLHHGCERADVLFYEQPDILYARYNVPAHSAYEQDG